jgi:predicted DNA-binding protein (UPF0278 family)
MKKIRVSVYLTPVVHTQLERFAREQDRPKSMAAESAIRMFLDPASDARREALRDRRLNQQGESLGRVERDLGLSLEMLAVFVRYWLVATPPVPEARRAEAHARGRQRFGEYLAAIGRRLSEGGRFSDELARQALLDAAVPAAAAVEADSQALAQSLERFDAQLRARSAQKSDAAPL